jgi:hypothetical protein
VAYKVSYAELVAAAPENGGGNAFVKDVFPDVGSSGHATVPGVDAPPLATVLTRSVAVARSGATGETRKVLSAQT